MTTPFKTQEEFQQWKDSNLWLWEFLAHRLALVNQQRQQYASNILTCPDEKINPLRREASALTGMASLTQQMLDLSFIDIESNKQAFSTPHIRPAPPAPEAANDV